MVRLVLILLTLAILFPACGEQQKGNKIKKLRSWVVDSLATQETLALFGNLKELTHTDSALIGQHNGLWCAPMGNYHSHWVKIAGKNPALLGKDYMDIINNRMNDSHISVEREVRSSMQLAYRRGNVNIMCWHYREPEERWTFYVKEMDEEKSHRLFKSLLPGGSNHESYKQDLKQIADFSKSLLGDNGELIPYIFRPFHEFDGDWFWWGKPFCSADDFINVWRFTVHYLKDSLQVHNLLYAFSPDIRFDTAEEYLERYPGDDYVDVLGLDDYYDFKSDLDGLQNAYKRIAIVSQLARKKGKIAALTETGYFVKKETGTLEDERRMNNLIFTLSQVTNQVAFIMFWSNGGSFDYCVPDKTEAGAQAFWDFSQSPNTLYEEDYKSIYTIK